MGREPRVSVIMANLNGAAHIAAAVRSVLRQTEASLELIVSDDGSSDDSMARAQAAAGGDRRLRLLPFDRRSGPGAARNRALDAARGRWVAIVDNDDLIHPQRLERLIAAAERDGADLVADDLVVFYEDGSRPPHGHLRGALARRPRWIGAAAYERSNRQLGPGPALGYLKPVLRRTLNLRYDESLRIGEDSDLVLRLLMRGARMRVYPDPGYFYRKHARSASHRLDAQSVAALQAAYARLDGRGLGLGLAFAEQRAALADAAAFSDIVAALKTGRLVAASGAALRRPGALLLFRDALRARLSPRRRPAEALPGPRIALLSRQRIVGATNGSSAYVLALAAALKDAGYEVDYVGASPKIFGRWAVLRLKPETKVFDRYGVHGGLKLGAYVLALNPAVWLASAHAVLTRALVKLGAPSAWSAPPAEYAQGAPVTREDALYVARRVGGGARAVLCDYAYLAPLAPYALAPDAPTLIIMHDLISARVADRDAENRTGKVAQLSSEAEFELLGLADAIVAIQAEEARRVKAALPCARVLLAPHGVAAVSAPQPGQDDALLFVGSNTAPNIVGLERFFSEVWPSIRRARPQARLVVAGSVARAFARAPEGVHMAGVVDDLAPLYRDAGVVVSPLYTGSGLKIKLVEALAAGKAVVGAPLTAQGVESLVAGALVLADGPAEFADAVTALLANRERREALGRAALECAEAHFSQRAAFADLIDYVREGGAAAREEVLADTREAPR